MKRFCLLILTSLLFCLPQIFSQNIPVYPIPSYGVAIIGSAVFKNSDVRVFCLREKHNALVRLNSASSEDPDCQGTVWLYSLDNSSVLGPYTAFCGETLTVEVDEREWGVLVESESKVSVDVWFE